MVLFHAYGDAEDEIDVWFPDLKHVHGSETIQGETFPNMYTLRGTKYRDPVEWYKGADNLLKYAKQADSYSGSHMRPWIGNEFIVDRITNYRDAIQYVHDQSVRLMNRGYTREELADAVKLPPHLADDPWLGQYYGSVAHSARNVYGGYLGWYQADPTALATPGFKEKAELYVKALGGRDAILKEAREAIDNKDYGWAMEILTYPIRVDHNDMEARKLKAEAMRKWAYLQPNIYWRGLALGGALELENRLDYSQIWNFSAPDIIKALPVNSVIESMRVKLDPEKAGDAEQIIGFKFTDIDEDNALEIRKGVAVFHEEIPEGADATFVGTRDLLDRILLGETDVSKALADGELTIEGDQKVAEAFFAYFDPPSEEPIKLIVR
jgi:alkyl sulfatase BDS1-like metallo-beta-lactamase superfamily hydrolase